MSSGIHNLLVQEFGETKPEDNFNYDGEFNIYDVRDVNEKRGYRIVLIDRPFVAKFPGDSIVLGRDWIVKSLNQLDGQQSVFDEYDGDDVDEFNSLKKGREVLKSVSDLAQGFHAFYWEQR